MSESDVYRRQILTYKDGPHAERVNLHSVACCLLDSVFLANSGQIITSLRCQNIK